jgi:hypothetical protein
MEHRFLCPGSKIELTADANVIPAGTYTFERRYDELLEFSVTPQIRFVLASSYWGHLVRPSPSRQGRTSESRFLRCYARLLKHQEAHANSIPRGAVSMCFMTKKAVNQVTRYLTSKSGTIASQDAYFRCQQRAPMSA